jgi:hypothetical protein
MKRKVNIFLNFDLFRYILVVCLPFGKQGVGLGFACRSRWWTR